MGDALPVSRGRLAPALVLNTGAFVVLELGLTRILAVAQWYHFAFMVISVSLLGGGLGPLVLTRLKVSGPRAGMFRLRRVAVALPLVTFASFWAFDHIPFEPFLLGQDASQWFYVPLGCLLLALPFFLAGMATALYFVIAPDDSHRLYFVDLAGAAAGALLFSLALATLNAYSMVAFACVLWGLAAVWLTRGHRTFLPAAGFAAGAVIVLFALAPQMSVRISDTKRIGDRPAREVLGDPKHTVFTGYSADSRVDVVRTRDGFRMFLDAGTAVTRIMRARFADRALPDLRAVMAELKPESVLVLGSGGGLEVRLALEAKAKRVVAVELNGLVNELVTGEFAQATGNVFNHPNVALHTDEGRSFLLGSAERFDLILCVHTISNAALSSGGLSLAENYTLTREAFETYFDHLSDRGVAFFTRPSFQLRRLYETAAAAWAERGLPSLAPHAIVGVSERQRFYGTLLVGRPALSPQMRQRLEAAFQRVGLRTPTEPPAPPRALVTPSTDDKPFFNQRVALTDLTSDDIAGVFGGNARLAVEDRPVAEVTMLLLLGQLTVLGGLLFIAPLVVTRLRERRQRSAKGKRTFAGAYFFLLGLAFLFVEMPLIQKLTLYLGQPTLAFAVVLAGMLVFAGLGSLTDRRFDVATTSPWPLAVGLPAVLVVTVLALRPVMDAVLGAGFGVRVIVALALIAPSSFLMGRPFARGLRWVAAQPDGVAWAFALNGLASVLASLLAVMLGMALGLTAVILIAAGLYVLAGLLMWRGQRLAAGKGDA